MSLLEHQMALGQCIRAIGAPAYPPQEFDRQESVQLVRLVSSAGFRFTRRVQRSWCKGRAESAARLTLSVLPVEQRRRLVDQWVEAGGGAASVVSAEAEAFLEFIARDLTDPSYQLTICRMEQACYRTSEAAMHFRPPDRHLLDPPAAMLCAGKGAALVQFFTEPQQLLDAIEAGEPSPPLSDRSFPVLFAPGLPQLFRAATDDEVALWQRLARPMAIRALSRDRRAQQAIEELFGIGAAELAAAQSYTG